MNNEVDNGKFKVSAWGCRHQQCLVLFCTLSVAYSMRSCMGVSLVAMTEYGEDAGGPNTTQINNFTSFFNALLIVPPYPKFTWNKKVQDIILASFFWGYMTLQIPAGQLAHRFGARYLMFGAMMINCVASILLPLAAYYGGWISAAICRLVQGLSQACIFPGIHTFLGRWAPLHERGRLASITYGGQALGAVLGLPICGFIASSPLGWPGIFRFFGILSGLVGVLLWCCGADTPAKHSKISEAERKYIADDLGQDVEKKPPVPWSKILTHKGVYAIIVAHIGQTWGQITLYSEVPAFMDKVMGVNIKANGLLTALPFLVMWITNFFFSWLTDMIVVKNLLSVTNTRKLANSIGAVPSAMGLIVLAYVPKDIYVVESLLVLICSFKVAAHSGFQLNHIDISPNYAGTIMSVSNFVSNSCSSLAPIVVGLLLTDVTNEYLWREVFFVAAALYLITNLVYVVFGTAEKADWNDPGTEGRQRDEEGHPMMEKSISEH